MKFLRVDMLLLVWTVPLLLAVMIYGMRRRRHIMGRFASKRARKMIAAGADNRRRRLKAGLLLLGVLLTVLALAGPQYGYQWQEIERRGVDLIVALDCSKSMLATDIKPTRLDRAKREVFDLLNRLQGDRVGLVAFAGSAFLQCPLTLDYAAFDLFLTALSPDFLPLGGTNLPAALQTALTGFDPDSASDKAVILITDGESTGGDPAEAAAALAAAGIKLFCIGVGQGEGVPVPDETGGFRKDGSGNIVLTRLDEATLQKIALSTGGAYVRSVAGDMDLEAIYVREIRGKMEAATRPGGRKRVWEDRYQWFLGLALLAFIAEILTPAVKKEAAVMILTALLVGLPSAAGYAAGGQGHLRRGLEAYDQKDYNTALKSFIDAQLENPDRPEIYYNLGNTYYRLGEYDAALKNYREALASDNPALRQKAQYNLGNASFRKGSLEEAAQSFEAALQMDPEDQQARQNLEFTRKMMQQQKQQQQSGGSQDSQDSQADPQNQPNKPNEPGTPPDQEQGEEGSPAREEAQDGQEARHPDGGQDEPSGTPPQAGQEEPAAPEEKTPEEEGRANAAGEASDPPENVKQAERILNRLHDKPGAAMMPRYQTRGVEKDW